MRAIWLMAAAMLAASTAVLAQPTPQAVPMGPEYSTPMPIEPEPRAAPAPQPVPQPVQQAPAPAPVQAPAEARPPQIMSSRGAPPPTLPANPRRRAIEAAASGGAGGMSYSGPAGAMSTAPSGAFCTVTCPDSKEYAVSCPTAHTAFCQCESYPYSSCRPQ